MSRLIVLLLFFAVIAFPAYAASDYTKQLSALNNSALKLFRAGDLDDAIHVWGEASEIVIQYRAKSALAAEVLNNLGYAYYKKMDYVKSERFLLKSVEISQDRWTAYLNLGDLYEKTNENEKAIKALKKLIELNPDYKYKNKIISRINTAKEKIETTSKTPDPFDKLSNDERVKAEKYWALENDDDRLTGIWGDVTDAAMAFYTLYEKTPNGYQATHYSPRYSVDRWVGKIEYQSNHVNFWEYEIVGERLELPLEPTISGEINFDGIYIRDNIVQYRITNKFEIAELARHKFATGKHYLEYKLNAERELRNSFVHYDAIKKGSHIIYSTPNNMEVVREEIHNGEKYVLLFVSFGLPHSGYCGMSSEKGYYWLRLGKGDNGEWSMLDEWAFLRNDCKSNEVVSLEVDKNRIRLFNSGPVEVKECYEIQELDNFNKKDICAN